VPDLAWIGDVLAVGLGGMAWRATHPVLQPLMRLNVEVGPRDLRSPCKLTREAALAHLANGPASANSRSCSSAADSQEIRPKRQISQPSISNPRGIFRPVATCSLSPSTVYGLDHKYVARGEQGMLRWNTLVSAVCLAAAAWCVPAFCLGDDDHGVAGAAYTMTNAAGPNSVLVYHRLSDGTLRPAGMVPTGGSGTGAGLGSQGAVVLSDSNRWLLVVNAGSDDITVFDVERDELEFAGKFASGGHMPISITVHGRLVYVMNAGTPNNITGFLLNEGKLHPIPGSTRTLSAPATGPAQVQFSPDGDLLVVTEKNTNLINVFPVGSNGVPGARRSTASHGMTPFGFAFGKRNHLIVSEAFGGAPNASALSSYVAHDDGSLTVVTGSAPTHQSAACWVVVDKSGRLTYTTNTGSGSITGFRIGPGGDLTILNPDGRTGLTPPGSAPIDAAFSNDGRFLYALTSNVAGISGFRVRPDGTLSPIGSVASSVTAVGLAVR
jgi:6-phosphogluconolactonase